MLVVGNLLFIVIFMEDGSWYVMVVDGVDGLVSGIVCGLKVFLVVDV